MGEVRAIVLSIAFGHMQGAYHGDDVAKNSRGQPHDATLASQSPGGHRVVETRNWRIWAGNERPSGKQKSET